MRRGTDTVQAQEHSAAAEAKSRMQPHLDRLRQGKESARESAESRYDELLDDVDDASDALHEKVAVTEDSLTELELRTESAALRAVSELATARSRWRPRSTERAE